jgi:phenylpyruvate tautomerase PptA (4-oxalocrotonate tautomerase family)
LGPEENVEHSRIISSLIRDELGIPMENIVIHFEQLKTHEIGYKGTTVAVIKEEEAKK